MVTWTVNLYICGNLPISNLVISKCWHPGIPILISIIRYKKLLKCCQPWNLKDKLIKNFPKQTYFIKSFLLHILLEVFYYVFCFILRLAFDYLRILANWHCDAFEKQPFKFRLSDIELMLVTFSLVCVAYLISKFIHSLKLIAFVMRFLQWSWRYTPSILALDTIIIASF